MNLNPNLAAVLIALCFGVVIFPWAKATSKLGIGEFFIVIGVIYIIFGILQCLFRKNALSYSVDGLLWALITGIIYVLALSGISYYLPRPETNLRVFVTITAAYPLVTTVISTVAARKIPSIQELSFILLVIVGIAGLSLLSPGPNV